MTPMETLKQRWDSAFDRRSIGRTQIERPALLFLGGRVQPCLVKNVTNRGAGIVTKDLPAVPVGFELSFDNFRTVRKCQLIWRNGDRIGVAFGN
jgi:hypothetical protein